MFGEMKWMMKRVIICDIFVGGVLAAVIQKVYNAYGGLFLLGLLMAFLSFATSGITTKKYFSSISGKHLAIMMLTNFLKIIVICIIGVIIYNNNTSNIISYILGFTSHFLALILYGIINLSRERK